MDQAGFPHILHAPQTRTPILNRFAWNAQVSIPADVVAGKYQFNASVKYSHISDKTCNKVYFLPGAEVTISEAIN